MQNPMSESQISKKHKICFPEPHHVYAHTLHTPHHVWFQLPQAKRKTRQPSSFSQIPKIQTSPLTKLETGSSFSQPPPELKIITEHVLSGKLDVQPMREDLGETPED